MVQLAKTSNLMFDGTADFLVAREPPHPYDVLAQSTTLGQHRGQDLTRVDVERYVVDRFRRAVGLAKPET